MSECRLKIGDFAPAGGPVDPKFQVEGVAPTNHSSSQKTRLNDSSYGKKILIDISSVLSQFTRLTDGPTEGRTAFSSLDRVCIPCIAVKITNLVIWIWRDIFISVIELLGIRGQNRLPRHTIRLSHSVPVSCPSRVPARYRVVSLYIRVLSGTQVGSARASPYGTHAVLANENRRDPGGYPRRVSFSKPCGSQPGPMWACGLGHGPSLSVCFVGRRDKTILLSLGYFT